MSDLILNSEVRLSASPGELFSLFGSGDPALGWLFGADASGLHPGALVRIAVPLGGLDGLDGTARIASVVPYNRIDLVHESPWHGRIRCRFDRLATSGTRVRVRVTISDVEIDRLGRDLGLIQFVEPAGNSVALGLLASLSGSAGILGRSTVNCAELAVSEINADGGVLGRPVRLVVADDATSPALGRVAMKRLLRTPDLSAVVGMHSSATHSATSPLAVANGTPYLYTPASEPTRAHPLLVRFGETPVDQLHRALPRLAEETGGRRWFFAGNDYSWPRAIGSAARRIVERMGGTVTGEGYLPMGATAFDSVIESIERSRTDHVISSFVGQDHVRFERAFVASGLRKTTRTFAPLLDDAVVEHLGTDAVGIWNVLGYFEGLDTLENRDFLQRYSAAFGTCSAPVSSTAEGVYEAVHTWALACHSGRGVDARAVLVGLNRVEFHGPRLHSRQRSPRRLLLGEARSDGISVLDELPGTTRVS